MNSNYKRLAGLALAAFALFVFISQTSYLFNWEQDMSLLGSSVGDVADSVGNKAGTLGSRLGKLLVCDLFGLGSYLLLIIPVAVAARLSSLRWEKSVGMTLAVSLSGTLVWSVALAYAGGLSGLDSAFGGGLGGRCGAAIAGLGSDLFGDIITAVIVFLLLIGWLILSSRRFNVWMSSLWAGAAASAPDSGSVSDSGFGLDSGGVGCADPTTSQGSWSPHSCAVGGTSPEADPESETGVKSNPEANPGADQEAETEAAPEAGPEGSFDIISDDTLSRTVEEELKPIDNRMDPPEGLPRYKFPSLDLLQTHSGGRREVSTDELTRNNNKIRAALKNYRIEVVDVKAIVGPTVTLYKVYPAPGVQIAQIKRLQEDIALSLNAKGVRVVTLSDSVGIEVANDYSSIVPLKSLLNDDAFRSSSAELPVAIGYTITQKVKVFDLADAPHLLIAGATKQGKSVGLNVIVSSLLYRMHPSELKFVFIDPKMVEFSAYSTLLKHYLAVMPDALSEEDEQSGAIVKNPKNAEKILRSLTVEMDERYELLSKAGVNKITLYNEKYKERHLRPDHGHRYLPYIVAVVDEYADLTMSIGASPETRAASKSITNSIIRLAQKGRAAGIHVILATQRPSVDVISGIIKSNFPMRIAFRVASRVDSMTILDAPGAEKLIGRGDMLFSAGIESERIQCGYVSGEEIEAITGYIGAQQGFAKSYNTPYYLPGVEDAGSEGGGGLTDMSDVDERFRDAAELVVTTQKASTSYLQTRLGMGFAKAARVMGQLEAAGVVGPQEGAKPRQILVPDLNSLQPILDSFIK